MFLNIWFIYLGAPVLGAYMFTVLISSFRIDVFVIMKCLSLFPIATLVLSSTLSEIRIATLSFHFHMHKIAFCISHIQSVLI